MILKKQLSGFYDIVKYPIITDKATRLIENHQYSFAVNRNATKDSIKEAIEYIFNVEVLYVNTMHMPIRKRKIKNIIGRKPHYKKAIVTLSQHNTINLLSLV